MVSIRVIYQVILIVWFGSLLFIFSYITNLGKSYLYWGGKLTQTCCLNLGHWRFADLLFMQQQVLNITFVLAYPDSLQIITETNQHLHQNLYQPTTGGGKLISVLCAPCSWKRISNSLPKFLQTRKWNDPCPCYITPLCTCVVVSPSFTYRNKDGFLTQLWLSRTESLQWSCSDSWLPKVVDEFLMAIMNWLFQVIIFRS